MKKINLLTLSLLFCGLISTQITAGDSNQPGEVSPLSPYLQLLVDDLAYTGQKISQPAEAIPGDKYAWRPEDSVRSISEVFVHIAGANYFMLSFVGAALPEGFSRDAEKTVTGKAEIAEFLTKSFTDASSFVSSLSDEELNDEVELPFGKFTKRQVLFIVANHIHEHLGQAIAYSRSNGIKPPWSKGEGE